MMKKSRLRQRSNQFAAVSECTTHFDNCKGMRNSMEQMQQDRYIENLHTVRELAKPQIEAGMTA